MPILTRINGKWTEGQALVKEGGTWKEIGAVTAKANGKWADIAPPKPAGKHWTAKDFTYGASLGILRNINIKSEIQQYFTIGDSFNIDPREFLPGLSFTEIERGAIPGLYIEGGKLVGTINGYSPADTSFWVKGYENGDSRRFDFRTTDRKFIPIKPAP